MKSHPEWVMDQRDFPIWLFWLAPGRETDADIHPDAEEIYYVVSGAGRLVMDGEEFRVSKGQTVYIAAGVEHQSFNDGEEDLCYFYAFAPPPSGAPKQEAQNWTRIQ